MADSSGKCEYTITPGWEQTGAEFNSVYSKGALSLNDAKFTRTETVTESSVQMKLSFGGCNKLSSLMLVTNARFVEVSVLKDSLLKYLATIRGTTPEGDAYTSEFPLFEGQFMDDTCEFRELHLKFLSIKPSPGLDSTQPVQLVLTKLCCEYTEGKPDTAPPLQQGPGGMGGGGGGGVEMMAMMAMSMMGGGMGGGRGGVPGLPGVQRGGPSTQNRIVPPIPPASTHSVNESDSYQKASAQDSASDSKHTATGTNSATNRAEPKSPTTPAHTHANAKSSAKPASAPVSTPAPAPGLDAAQLASIMWTVKGSMVDEIGQLLDRKLAPVMARLDGIDAKLRTLESEVRALQDNSSADSNSA